MSLPILYYITLTCNVSCMYHAMCTVFGLGVFSTSISHVSIALFEFRVGCHSGFSGDNRVYPELVNALIEQM